MVYLQNLLVSVLTKPMKSEPTSFADSDDLFEANQL